MAVEFDTIKNDFLELEAFVLNDGGQFPNQFTTL
jgi:hypothetical protein